MSNSLALHDIVKITAVARSANGANWISIGFVAKDRNHDFTVTTFFKTAKQGKRYAELINTVGDSMEQTPHPGQRQYLKFDETADLCRFSPRTLHRLLEVGEGPAYIRVSDRRLIFDRAEVERWLEGRRAANVEGVRAEG